MHPVDVHADRRGKYVGHTGKYDFSPLYFPVLLQTFGCFALRNNMSINIYGVDDDKKVIYPLHISSTFMPDRHVDLLLFECDGVQHYTTIRNFSRLVGRQLSNHGHTVHCCRRCLHAYSLALSHCGVLWGAAHRCNLAYRISSLTGSYR